MQKRQYAALAALFLMMGGTAGSARAQADFDMGSQISTLNIPRLWLGNGQSTPRNDAAQHLLHGKAVSSSATSFAKTAFRSSPAVTARVRQQFVNWVGKTDGPQAASAIGAELAKKDYLAQWAAAMGKDGLKRGDVADALTAYMVQNWQIANHIMETSTPQVQGALKQIRVTLATNPTIAHFTDAQKQEMAEIFVYNQLVQGALYSKAIKQNDAGLKQKASDAAVARFQNEMHVNLRQLKLTPNGFQSS